jgi:O-antigen/teichoic acid export membrane protein
MVLLKLAERGTGLASLVILARVLAPADFGLVAIATSIIGVMSLFTAFSFDIALIQNPNTERRHYDTVWSMELIFATGCALVLMLLAGPAASFYDEPRLRAIIQVLAVGTFLVGLQNVGVITFRKEMQFHKEFVFVFSKKLVAFVVTVTLALLRRDYWALIAGTLSGMVTGVAMSYVLQPYRPRFSLAAGAELFSFSRWLFVNNTLGFFYNRAADFILAKGLGPSGLGYYSVGYEISNLPSTEIVAPVNRAVFPGYARMSSDLNVLRQGFLNVLSIIAFFALPAAVGLACVADLTVGVFLGSKWAPSIPLIRILAVNGALNAILSCCGYVYLAVGKPRYVTYTLGAHVAMAVPMVTWATFHLGLVAVAWALLIASVLLAPVNYWLVAATLQIKPRDLVAIFWRPVVASGTMAVFLMWARESVTSAGFGNFVGLVVSVGSGAVVYFALVHGMWLLAKRPFGAEEYLLRKISERPL